MKQGRLRGTLLATSSVLALTISVDRSADAAACTLVVNPTVPYSQGGNTCVVFTANPGTSGSVTNAGTVTATGTVVNHTATGIGVYIGVTLNGSITNQGTITGPANAGIFMDQSSISGSITNSIGATITAHTGILIQGAGGGSPASVGGSVINFGTINSTGGGIGVGVASVGGGVTNAGTISSGLPAMVVSELTITGSVVNSNILNVNNGTAALLVSNGGSIGGSVVNSGAISNTHTAGVAIKVFPATPGINQTISGSVINDTAGTLTAAKGIVIVGFYSNALASVTHDVANKGTITAGFTGIEVLSATIGGAVTNSGTITAGQNGIQLLNYTAGAAGAPSVAGGIANSGTITSTGAGFAGIDVVGAMVSGGVTNSAGGSITASNGAGILISNTGIEDNSGGTPSTFTPGPSSVTGGIDNLGTITAKTGIMVTGGSSVAGGINNSGNITGSRAAIDVTGEGVATTINQTGGAITGNILLSGLGDTVNITGGSLAGDIVGQGPSGAVNFALGSGTFSYSNAITGVSAVNVNSGTVFDNNAITATAVKVNGGTLAPGLPNTPGTLSITGSLVFTSAAAYMITINGASASKTVVTGPATAGGATVKVASGSQINFGQTYTILTATGGVSGTFNPAVTFGALTGTLSYDADDVFLTFKSGSLAPLLPPGAPQNVINVANAIDNALAAGGTLPSGFSNLFNFTPQQLVGALTQLSGEAATGAQESGFQLMTSFLSLLTGPSGGGSGSGPALPFAPERADVFPADAALAYASVLKAPPIAYVPRWNSWGAAFGGSSTTSGDPSVVGSHDVTAHTGGFAAGMDYRLSPDTVAGFALAGGGTGWSLSAGLGGGHSDAFMAGLYGSKQWGQAYLSGALSYASYWMSTSRTIAIAGTDTLSASFNAQSFGGRLEGGYRITSGTPFRVVPYAAVQAQSFWSPRYSESGSLGASDPLALTYASQVATVVRSELGSRLDQVFAQAGGSSVDVFSRVAWAHDWQSNPNLSATFIGLPTATFVVNGATPPSDLALATAGAEWRLRSGWSVMAKFDGEFANRSQTYTGTAKLSYTW